MPIVQMVIAYVVIFLVLIFVLVCILVTYYYLNKLTVNVKADNALKTSVKQKQDDKCQKSINKEEYIEKCKQEMFEFFNELKKSNNSSGN